MNKNKRNLNILIGLLIIFGVFLTVYRHTVYQIPYLPGQQTTIWSIEAKIKFKAEGESVKLLFSLPNSQEGFTLLDERTASPSYNLNFINDDQKRLAEWSSPSSRGPQTVYYQVDMQESDTQDFLLAIPPAIEDFSFPEPEATAINQILQAAQKRAKDPLSLAQKLIEEFNQQKELTQLLTQNGSRIQWLVKILNKAQIPTRRVNTLELKDQRRSQSLIPQLQVFSGDSYRLLNPETGELGRQSNQMVWGQQASSVVNLVGGHGATVGFSMIKRKVPLSSLNIDPQRENGLLNFSIHNLPLEEQALFKSILLMPVGVLLVVFLRIFIGLRTSGTFMPVLIAIAFIQTTLITGLIGFILILALGLVIRAYLSQHNLLLVARISAVIILVIFIIAIFTMLAFRIGLSEGLKITFFPMIILAWTIERLSILWEEEGAKEVFSQGGGSLFVAVLAYLAMDNMLVKHLTFNFMGLQFIFMALVLLSGSYTGYRLSELRRFKQFVS